MNKTILLILIYILYSCETPKETNISEIIVYKVNLNIDTSIEVDCNDFQSTFSKKIKTYSIKDKIILNKLYFLLKKTKKSKENISLDVRKKIIILYKNKTSDTLCIDRFNIMINSQLIEINNDLLDFSHDL
ncbi:hypothetical protein NTJ12_001653 [Flavobacterium psychrophilum]|nr:hypothetical protein [Flavobacterium psychrophilum]